MHFRVVTIACATFAFLAVACDARTTSKTYAEKRDRVYDLETSASGYIYRTDGQNPPVFIKLGDEKNEKFDAIMENFKKGNGFHEMPTVGPTSASPYNIPIVGQEKIRYKDHRTTSHFDDPTTDHFDDGKYGSDSVDGFAPIMDIDNHHFDVDNDDDGFGMFNFGPSPFKFHHDVSSDGLNGDSYGFNNENYYGSPYTHNEYKSPEKHHSKGGSFQKAGHYFSQGSLGDSGYKNHHDYDKSHAGKYGKNDLKSHYKKASGHNSGHANEADHYSKHHSGTHGKVGHKFGESESHKKGHKTTGFHNVYHKDEYNKEQKFYDDAHKHGKYDRFGGKHKDFGQKESGHKYGSHHESGYDEGHKDVAGIHNKGGYYDGHKGHSDESGHKSHHDHKTDYDSLSDNKKFGEHESGGGSVGDDFY